jgi:hypothetical protein
MAQQHVLALGRPHEHDQYAFTHRHAGPMHGRIVSRPVSALICVPYFSSRRPGAIPNNDCHSLLTGAKSSLLSLI